MVGPAEFILSLLCLGQSTLVAKWDFTTSMTDAVGNFGGFRYSGNVSDVHGTGLVIGQGGKAAAIWPGAIMIEKTMISWLTLNDVTNKTSAGAAICLYQTQDIEGYGGYDSISWGVWRPGTWEAESGYSRRTPYPDSTNPTSTVANVPMKMSAVYKATPIPGQVKITMCRDDIYCKSWVNNFILSYSAASSGAEVMFGPRYRFDIPNGYLIATISAAEIHDTALTAAQLKSRLPGIKTRAPTAPTTPTTQPTSTAPTAPTMQPTFGENALVAKWDFTTSLVDAMNNFGPFNLSGGATWTSNVGLILGPGAAATSFFPGAVIDEKTFIVWLTLTNLSELSPGGAGLCLAPQSV